MHPICNFLSFLSFQYLPYLLSPRSSLLFLNQKKDYKNTPNTKLSSDCKIFMIASVSLSCLLHILCLPKNMASFQNWQTYLLRPAQSS